MEVIKRDGQTIENFDKTKIYNAIMKSMQHGSGIVRPKIAQEIADIIEDTFERAKSRPSVAEIEALVFQQLVMKGQILTARSYESYRAVQAFKKNYTQLDHDIEGIVDGENKEVTDENSNKNSFIASTQRDLIAGEYSKDYTCRNLLPEDIMYAHDNNIIHFHDADYFLEHIHNCFGSKTRFVTSNGVVSFGECANGQEVEVIDKDGVWRKATVKKYGQQRMQIVTLKSGRTIKEVKCTANHRWILKDGSVTTNIKPGDQLHLLNETVNTEPINPYAFCLGFVIGDGTDYIKNTSQGVNVRLCGDKIQYLDMFIKAGYSISKTNYENGDILLLKSGKTFKQRFIENHAWEYMSKNDLISLFNGYYAADGFKGKNGVATANPYIAQMIRDISALSGYFITSEKYEVRDTNYKSGAELYTFRFMRSQHTNRNWKVESINCVDSSKYDAWCVEEPITHSFTLDNGIVTGNCCLVNLDDMLQNGTVINKKMIESPKSFRVACTVATQIVQQVANGQYGGQTISVSHLAPFLRVSKEKIRRKTIKKWERIGMPYTEEMLENSVMEDLRDELKDGVQTIQYQINTFSTCNGQAPFLSIFMYINEKPGYAEETAMIIEEMLRQRIQGLKNEKGVYITPSFPKLLYVTDEGNVYPGTKYFYLTRLAAECTAKRMVPDYISAKIMKEQYDGEVFPCMGCRSFLTPWKDENGNYKWYGRFNQGVVTLNLVDVALSAEHNLDSFWEILNNRLQMCYDALMIRHNRLRDTPTSVSPIHWKYGAISRLKGENFNELLMNGYSTISLGYAGLFECVYALIGESHTTQAGHDLAIMIIKYLNDTCKRWRDETSIAFSLYGTPLESTTYKFARSLKERFGIIENVTDHDYVTNSYHVNVREEISAEDKMLFEAEFQKYSSGGCISYIETCNLSNNIDVAIQLIQFMYEHIRYAELNGKFDYCHECGYEGEIKIDDNNEWYCPNCGNKDKNKMNVARRTCGYIGDNFWNYGRTAEIKDRYVHVDNKECSLD